MTAPKATESDGRRIGVTQGLFWLGTLVPKGELQALRGKS